MDELKLYRSLLDDDAIRDIEAVQARVSGKPRNPREALVQQLAQEKKKKRTFTPIGSVHVMFPHLER